MAGLIAAAQALADRVTAAGVSAYVDPAKASANRPCVLVTPPTIDYVTRANTWRLVALSGRQLGSLEALDELDDLVVALAGSDLPIERAEPASYVLTPDAGPTPAYLLTVTT